MFIRKLFPVLPQFYKGDLYQFFCQVPVARMFQEKEIQLLMKMIEYIFKSLFHPFTQKINVIHKGTLCLNQVITVAGAKFPFFTDAQILCKH